LLVQKDLAATLKRLVAAETAAAKAGKTRVQALSAAHDLFYKGDLAKQFVAFYKENDRLFDLKDFADYAAVFGKPIHTTYRGYDIYSNGPTSRGGVQTLMNLNLLEAYEVSTDVNRTANDNPKLVERMAAGEAPEPVARLAHVLVQRNRIPLLPEIAARFDSHLDEWLNRVEATLVTAIPMTPDLEGRIMKSIERFVGKRVRLKSRIDTNLIGGFVVYTWGVLFDFSLRTRLDRLRNKLFLEEN
jgi:ATP synthase F1 delta subunit